MSKVRWYMLNGVPRAEKNGCGAITSALISHPPREAKFLRTWRQIAGSSYLVSDGVAGGRGKRSANSGVRRAHDSASAASVIRYERHPVVGPSDCGVSSSM